jgi:glycosidase
MYDINGSSSTRDMNTNGWFVDEMPDLNQKNPFVAKYLIQNTIWWIEYSGLDGIREDTYPYPDQKYLADWAAAIFDEYPDFNIVGEIWIEDAAYLAPYQKGNLYKKEFDTHLPSITDFCLSNAILEMVIDKKGIASLYNALAKDHLYTNPDYLLTFVDNHDMERLMYILNGDIARFKMIFTFLLTTRGIPQIYYGTEIGLKGGKGHGALREDFPGGFPGDDRNAFIRSGRTALENDLFDFFKKLLELRTKYQAISLGKLIHYPPKDEVYFYFRIYKNQKILVVLNNNKKQKVELPDEDFLQNAKSMVNLITNQEFDYVNFEIDSLQASIYLIRE